MAARLRSYFIGAARYNDGTVTAMSETEMYEDVNTRTVRTYVQDEEIRKLKDALEEKKKAGEIELRNLIAYYYQW